MKKLAIALLAAAGVALSVPASAQGVWVGAGPVGVGVVQAGVTTTDIAPAIVVMPTTMGMAIAGIAESFARNLMGG